VDEVEAVQRSWQEAAADLGIEVEVIGDAVLLPDFGSRVGMVCALRRTPDGWEALRHEAEARGDAAWSALGHGFLRYDREVFIDALKDWGWFGNGRAPDWREDASPLDCPLAVQRTADVAVARNASACLNRCDVWGNRGLGGWR
jgi:hypothetical protein